MLKSSQHRWPSCHGNSHVAGCPGVMDSGIQLWEWWWRSPQSSSPGPRWWMRHSKPPLEQEAEGRLVGSCSALAVCMWGSMGLTSAGKEQSHSYVYISFLWLAIRIKSDLVSMAFFNLAPLLSGTLNFRLWRHACRDTRYKHVKSRVSCAVLPTS